MELSEREVNLFLATYIDTEGHISFVRVKHRNNKCGYQFRAICSIEIGDREPLDLIQKHFGGYVYPTKQKYLNGLRNYWAWYPHRDDIPTILRRIIPFMIVKGKKAQMALDYFDKYPNVQSRRLNPERMAYCEELWKKMKTLNHKGGNFVVV